jgi:hypothetical protein
MAASKNKKADRKSTDFNFRSSVRDSVVPMGDDSNKNEPHISWTVFFAVLVVCVVLVIILPALGVMYMDMNNATIRAMEETKKMRELRAKILLEIQGE